MSFVAQELPGRHDLLALAAAHPGRFPALLESAAPNASARNDILFALPREAIVAESGEESVAFLARLDAAWHAARTPRVGTGLPFRGGWCVLLTYELARECEPGLSLPDPPVRIPVAIALRCAGGVSYDHLRDVTTVLVEDAAAGELPALVAAVRAARLPIEAPASRAASEALEEEPEEQFLAGVARIGDYLAAGDVFQVNLSRAWSATLAGDADAVSVYRALRHANPSPYAGLFRYGNLAVLSSSPERLVSVAGHEVATRPIAGTRPRDAGEDHAARVRELVGHPKERAEHVMLIDLERNDLGRVCMPGSIEVDELMSVESYAHVHHIVSNVRGRLRPGATPGEVIRAVFPGGTITGCPKVRCMQIIAELEQEGRGPYTGALGYLNRDGDMDLNILIRTIWIVDGVARFRAGSGIVADSIAQRELEETRAKARGLVRALCPSQAGGA
ncbi:MAG TPA: aminodeoxychorismate synthase component I [Candidatus Saccharimonadia bacterium]|nr:aminodeoxychorismate synthase component I [Candidatus Saccharimonadia bacterium]